MLAEHRTQAQGEVDFVVVVPSLGVLCLEVKAHHRIRLVDGTWTYGSSGDRDLRGPFKQASDNMHSLRAFVAERAPALSTIPFWSAVVFPYAPFKITSPEWHGWQIVDDARYRSQPISRTLYGILERARLHLVEHGAAWFDPSRPRPTPSEAETLVRLLRPRFEVAERVRRHRERLVDELIHFTDEQCDALDLLETNRRVLFTGPAGVGKTVLALEAARRAVASGRRAALLCFNADLGAWLSEQASRINPKVPTMTLHGFMRREARLAVPAEPPREFWHRTLPDACLETLLEDGGSRFDELIIDEAQDVFRHAYLDVLDLALSGGLGAGRWVMFGDFERQSIYDSDVSLDEFRTSRGNSPAVFPLRINCRNRPRIAGLASMLGGLDPDYRRVRRPDDQVEADVISYRDRESELAKLEEILLSTRELPFEWQDIVILSPRASGSAPELLSAEPSWRDRLSPLRQARDGQIRYATLHSFKGLEAPVVIVTDIDDIERGETRDLLYIAVTRPLERLYLLVADEGMDSMRRMLTRTAAAR
jgi:hypothetical protein